MKNNAKIFISIILVLTAVFTLSSCGNENSEKDEASSKAPYTFESGENIHTIVLVSDTQVYAQKLPEDNVAMISALIEEKDKYNIEYVIHAGDLVQTAESDSQWETAKKSMDQLLGVIPFGVCAGNHDQSTGDDRFTAYCNNFGEEYYSNCDYFAESFENCRCQYQLVSIGSTDFIVVYISDDPSKACISFANEAFAKYPDRVGILVTHKYLETDLSLEEMGEYMLKNIITKNSNVAMVLCGHESAVGYLETKLDDGRTILQIMGNYQDIHDGSMLYLQIDEDAKTLTGISYSPLTDSYEGYSDSDSNHFRVDLPWELKK